MNRSLLLFLAGLPVFWAGCTLAPKYTRPPAPAAAHWPSGPAYAATTATNNPGSTRLNWEEFFQDEKLYQVIGLALTNNRDLRVAAMNVELARAQYGIQRAELWPTVDASGSGSRQLTPADLSSGGRRQISERYDVNLGVAAWEIDFFGHIRSLKDRALQEYLATEQARRGAQIILVEAVANTYLTLAADRENLELATTTLASQRHTYELIQRRFNLGLVPALNVSQAQMQVDAATGDVAHFTQLVAQDLNALNLLAGGEVSEALLPETLSRVTPPEQIAPGLPSEVLLQRPDVLQAESLLRAAYADVGAARAAFFPRISLTASIGTASSDLSGLFAAGSGVWSYAPQIIMPIFDARTWSAHRAAKVQQKLVLAQYEQAIQNSFKEVADALALCGTMEQRLQARQSEVKAAAETYRLSMVRYNRGIDGYLGVLDAQRTLYAAQQGLVALQLTRFAGKVQLFTALGGDWQAPATPDTP